MRSITCCGVWYLLHFICTCINISEAFIHIIAVIPPVRSWLVRIFGLRWHSNDVITIHSWMLSLLSMLMYSWSVSKMLPDCSYWINYLLIQALKKGKKITPNVDLLLCCWSLCYWFAVAELAMCLKGQMCNPKNQMWKSCDMTMHYA